ncbi:4'-phosphopantetheinyl transferase family protein [Motilimonas eburnea]|uniref:4'-phosphopantetheinyl transferase family protein n=1 Tax=Motilimonas eburnea TaxID=1737488 RepID=UPI001E47A558|nr:4'-phosphopantetheinyl transferase superfamily protein [Motilimonas eburnea]MCE2570352.1 4'-phosphopantetheinyl transferase superfamily protein [Motilimonas eburnea]
MLTSTHNMTKPSKGLTEGAIDIHIAQLGNKVIPIQPALTELTAQQQQKANQLQEINQLRFIKQRLFLNRILRAYLYPQRLTLTTDVNGKPMLLNTALQFNLSHCGNYLILALCQKGQIGVDICLHKHEQSKIERLWRACFDQHGKVVTAKRFYSYWALQEAWLKATGEGWHGSPSRINTLSTPLNDGQCIEVARGFYAKLLPLKKVLGMKNCQRPITAAICHSHFIDKINYYNYQLD